MSTRTYRCYVDSDGKSVPKDNAVAVVVTAYEVIHRDGTESLLDEWIEPLDEDWEAAREAAYDAKYHERKEEGL